MEGKRRGNRIPLGFEAGSGVTADVIFRQPEEPGPLSAAQCRF
jgi:hypothetical protein